MNKAVAAIDQIVRMLEFYTELDNKKVANENSKMLYKLYDQYSFTPADVNDKIESQNTLIASFVEQLFKNLSLDVRNKEKALVDARILAEKFISINGDNEAIFKEDRNAYLINCSSAVYRSFL